MGDEWSFELNGVGMTAFHQAGLLGLAASLRTGTFADVVTAEFKGNQLTLHGLGTEPEELYHFFQRLYWIEDGLIRFPLYNDLSESYRAAIQNVLLTSFLQHPSSRRADRKSVTRGLGEDDTSFTYLPLHDFRHRYEDTLRNLSETKLKRKPVQVAGWAYPGAVVKHTAHSSTSIQDTPDRYFLLLCAPLGCLWYQARAYLENGDWDPKTQSVIVLPRPTRLEQESLQLYQFYRNNVSDIQKLPLSAGVADASLQSAIALQQGNGSTVTSQFQVMRFGTVGWSSQQKTRTGTLMVREPKERMEDLCDKYEYVMSCLPALSAQTGKGVKYEQMMPMREQIAKNFLSGVPWYVGLSEYIQGGRSWAFQKNQWREGLRKLAQNPELWDSDKKKLFVDLVQQAVATRYGQVNAKAQKSGADRRSLFRREYDRMVLDFQHCRTREMLRETLMQFIARSRPRLSEPSSGVADAREILLEMVFQNSVDWREVRDLCLLSIATYKGSHSEQVDEIIDGEQETEA